MAFSGSTEASSRTSSGCGVGVLPHSRAFEARLTTGALVKGKVDRAVPNITALKQRWESVEAELSFRVIRVRDHRRYVLTGAAGRAAP